MSHYEKRLEEDLAAIRERILGLQESIAALLKDSVHALITWDRKLANQTILGDNPINREVRRLDASCHAFVARHLPSAGHLRFVSSVLRVGVALERIGDYAASICRETTQLASPPPEVLARDIDLMSDQSRRVLALAVQSFVEGNAELARGTMGMAAQSRDLYGKVFDDLLEQASPELPGLKSHFALQVVLYRLERVSAQAKNICEEAIFAATGETKAPKTYRILFVDEDGEIWSPLAAAFARKAFPESGRFSSAGFKGVRALPPAVASFLESKGLDSEELATGRIELTPDHLNDYHVIVGLEGSLFERIPEVPFKTVVLDWNLARDLSGLDRQRADAVLEEVHREIAHRVRELMEILRGEDAA